MVPDDILLTFFRSSRNALLELDCSASVEIGNTWTTADCRRCILDKQRSVLNATLSEYNMRNGSSIFESDQVYQRLASIKTIASENPAMDTAMKDHDEAARWALCKLALYCETRRKVPNQDLQTKGKINRSKLLEYLGLCQTAVRLELVQKHLKDGSPLFDDVESTANATASATAMKLPQVRMEYIQRILAQAVGLHPTLVTQEITRIFIDPATSFQNEFSNDEEAKNVFNQLISQMQAAVANASSPTLSDKDEGGFTSVVSVKFSEVGGDGDGIANAPKKMAIELSHQEQIRQIRLASQAKALQEELLKEIEELSPSERASKLEHAKQVSNETLLKMSELPPGNERLQFLQSIDSETSRLLTVYKLWMTMHGKE